jgi:hypothetical protein
MRFIGEGNGVAMNLEHFDIVKGVAVIPKHVKHVSSYFAILFSNLEEIHIPEEATIGISFINHCYNLKKIKLY